MALKIFGSNDEQVRRHEKISSWRFAEISHQFEQATALAVKKTARSKNARANGSNAKNTSVPQNENFCPQRTLIGSARKFLTVKKKTENQKIKVVREEPNFHQQK